MGLYHYSIINSHTLEAIECSSVNAENDARAWESASSRCDVIRNILYMCQGAEHIHIRVGMVFLDGVDITHNRNIGLFENNP